MLGNQMPHVEDVPLNDGPLVVVTKVSRSCDSPGSHLFVSCGHRYAHVAKRKLSVDVYVCIGTSS